MDLLVEYQTELLALLAILVVILIYVNIKRKKENKPFEQIGEKPVEEFIETIKEEEKKSNEETEQEEVETISEEEPQEETVSLDGKEEGDFGVAEEIKPPKQEETKKAIVKREVPPHGKIAKEDFKEFAGQRILLAEDNIINQKVILGLLAESGIEIVVANDGVEVLEELEKDDNFILILMDAHMPRIDGFEATRKIRANPKYDHIVVVALSGDTAADDIRKMKEAGMSEHLEKPLKMDALYDILYAYTPCEKSDSTNINFTEIDIEEGMEISGNDSSFYHEILEEFLNSYSNAHEIIDGFIKHNKLDHADRLLLDIIGVSANIGANKLNQTAINLKTSLHSNDNQKSRLLFKFKEDLENLLKDIKSYLS